MKIIIQENCTEIWWRDVTNGAGMACTDYAKNGKQDEIIAALENALQQAKAERHLWGDRAFPFGGSSCSTAESETIKHDASMTIGINVDTNTLTALENQLTRIAELSERIQKTQYLGEPAEYVGQSTYTISAGQVFIAEAQIKDGAIQQADLIKEVSQQAKKAAQMTIESELQVGGKLWQVTRGR